MRKAWRWALVLVLAGGGAWWWIEKGKTGSGSHVFRTAEVARGDVVQTVTANGALEAVQTVLVGSEVSGKIMELFADYNSAVTNGQVLARLDASTYERQLDQAEAELESSRASLKLAEANYRRAKELRELELLSQADYDQAEASLAQARASLRMREASVSKVEVDLEKTTIFSPMDGVVISRAVDVGQTVAASLNAPTLFTLAQDLREMRIGAQISEADVGGVREGQTVLFTVDAFPMQTFTGVVRQVRYEPVSVQNVVNYVAMVDVDNAEMKLRPGMTANAAVETARRSDVLRLPNAALRFRPPEGLVKVKEGENGGDAPARPEPGVGERGERRPRREGGGGGRGGEGAGRAESRRTVYVLTASGMLEERGVMAGITDGTWTEILGGHLSEGELVVTGVEMNGEKKPAAAPGGGNSPFMPSPPRMRR